MINKNKTRIDALIKEAMRIRDEAIDHGFCTEEEFAADIANYLSDAKLSKALIECRNAVAFGGHCNDSFNRLADGIVKLIDADLQDDLANDIRVLTARVSDAETIATSTKEQKPDAPSDTTVLLVRQGNIRPYARHYYGHRFHIRLQGLS